MKTDAYKFIIFCILMVFGIMILIIVRKAPDENESKQKDPAKKIKVLLDTDIGGDVDDVGALVILNNFVNQGVVELLAVGVCSYNP